METNKKNLKTQTKTRLGIQLSQTLRMNAAQDIKILNMYVYFAYTHSIDSITKAMFKFVFIKMTKL